MSISFPYERKQIEEGGLVDPRITLEIKTTSGFLAMKFLVDSGADVTTLPLTPYAELFNFRQDPKSEIKISGIEGKGVTGYPFSLHLRLRKHEFKIRCYFIKSQIDPLLGRLDFWRFYSITFDNNHLKTIFIPVGRR